MSGLPGRIGRFPWAGRVALPAPRIDCSTNRKRRSILSSVVQLKHSVSHQFEFFLISASIKPTVATSGRSPLKFFDLTVGGQLLAVPDEKT